MKRCHSILFLLCCTIGLPTYLVSQTLTHEHVLRNGLKIIVKENHRAPVVVSQVWYKVGSSYEPAGLTGISHALEHMMFRGTPHYGPGVLSRTIRQHGGAQNASTYYDYTNYYQTLAAQYLDISFQLESDRMQHLLLDKQAFQHEIQVVMEERRLRTDDQPQAKTYERFLAAAHTASPYHHPVIGWMHELQHLHVQDLRQWYHRWYTPNNAVLVVVGDVDPHSVFTRAERYFGPIKPRPLPTLKPLREIVPLGTRQIDVHLPAQLPWLIMGYQTPSLNTASKRWHAYALDVAASLLDLGKSARLPKQLIRKQHIATDASVGYGLYRRLDTLFTVEGTPSATHTIGDLKQAFDAEIQKLRTTRVTPQALARVKAQIIAHHIYQQDSLSYQAHQIGRLEVIGRSWKDADAYVDRIRAITPQQIQWVARHYLTPQRLTVAVLHPIKKKRQPHA